MENERKDKGIKKERNKDISNKKNKEMKKGRKRQPTPQFFIPVNDASFSSKTRDRTHAPLFTATGLIHCATDACYCCLLNWIHTKNIGRLLFVSLVFAKPHA